MRTLKKTLSLVLVVAMVLGLCVVGASAYNKVEDFTDDVDKIGDAYYEAVGVLTGIGIIDGMTETAFEPQGNYTREQAAKIIAYMQLGKAKADSLKCTVAPFEDVAASRWSAGYIAYCVEQGIIDGMTETTFEPTAKLTGFQWAKMLLCAVGFGVNGEFTGSSWSVNTAKVAHTVDLFAGDLAGADHTALTREQAALYAFNVLTNVKKVAYSANVTSYVYGIRGYWTVDGIGHTLATDVFDLYSATGIITDNEGNGASATTLRNGYYSKDTVVATVAADTTLDMMYHAARIWYIDGTKTDTGVFVMDLAKATEYDCYAVSTGEAAAKKVEAKAVSVGTNSNNAKVYEYYLIDNTVIDAGYAGLSCYYTLGKLGVRSETNKTTVIDNTAVANSMIKTDISKIDKYATVIYLKTEHKAYHVYALSATAGSVVKYNQNTKVITMSDGTELSRSVFAAADINDQISTYIIDVLVGTTHSTPKMTIVLDSHGHYMSLSNEAYKTVAYYTGAYKLSSSHDAWSSDRTWMAQFVDVATGEVKEVPVLNSWYERYGFGGYYDITDELYGDATYYPIEVPTLPATTYGAYRFDNSLTLSRSDKTESGIYYDVSDITYIIASGSGSKLSVKPYQGIDALLDAYDYDRPISSVTLSDVCVVVANSVWGNEYATVVFAYDAGLVTGGVVFFPTDVAANDWHTVSDSYYEFDSAYVNGSAEAEDFKVAKGSVSAFNLTAGFYSFTLDANTGYAVKLDKVTTFWTNDSSKFTGSGTSTVLDGVPVASDVVIADVRPNGDIDTIKELADFYNNYADNGNYAVQLAYTKNAAGQIAVIYVVPANAYTVTVKTGTSNSATAFTTPSVDPTSAVYKYWSERPATLKITVTTGDNLDFNGYVLVYTINGVEKTVGAADLTVSGDGNQIVSFNVSVDNTAEIVVLGYRPVA